LSVHYVSWLISEPGTPRKKLEVSQFEKYGGKYKVKTREINMKTLVQRRIMTRRERNEEKRTDS